MSKHITPATPPTTGSPIEHPIQAPRKVNPLGRPKRDPNRGGGLGAVTDGSGPQDFSSRQPGGSFAVRPTDPQPTHSRRGGPTA